MQRRKSVRSAASGSRRRASKLASQSQASPAARPQPSTYDRIWAVVRRIPRGRVATYGQIATLAGLERQPRLAGYAMHALPHGSDVPWHRVVAAGGRIAVSELDGHAALQRALLESEGVVFRGLRVDLDRSAWSPRWPAKSRI
jgi:methylated-DNA-protein-cysteine methyltransferase related protein